MAAAKKTASKKKAPAKKAAAKQGPAKKVAAKKAAVTKPAARKTAATKSAPKKVVAKKSPAKKSPAKKSPAKKPAVKKAPTAKAAVKTTSGKAATARPAPKRAPNKMSSKKSAATTSPLLSNEVPTVHEIPAPRGTSKDGISYTKDFDVKFLKAQRDELEARRASELKRAMRLEDEAESLIEDGEMGDVQFDDEGGEGDTMVVQRDLDRLLSSQARQTIEEIDEALERIKLGTYGYSVVSGLPIPRERLEALPETTVLAAEKVSGAGRR